MNATKETPAGAGGSSGGAAGFQMHLLFPHFKPSSQRPSSASVAELGKRLAEAKLARDRATREILRLQRELRGRGVLP